MKKHRILVLLSLLLIALASWTALRLLYPPGEVNYLNYLLLRRGSSIDEIEGVIGPFNDPRETDALTGDEIIRPSNQKGVVKCIWFDKAGPFGNRKIYITFINGRATEFRYFSPSF